MGTKVTLVIEVELAETADLSDDEADALALDVESSILSAQAYEHGRIKTAETVTLTVAVPA